MKMVLPLGLQRPISILQVLTITPEVLTDTIIMTDIIERAFTFVLKPLLVTTDTLLYAVDNLMSNQFPDEM